MNLQWYIPSTLPTDKPPNEPLAAVQCCPDSGSTTVPCCPHDNATVECPPIPDKQQEAGARISETDPNYVGGLLLDASDGYSFEDNYAVSVTVTQLSRAACAGIFASGMRLDSRGYGFFICGNGHWHILKYSPQKGFPTALLESSAQTSEPASKTYTIVVVISNHTLHMTIDSPDTGQTHSVIDDDPDYDITELLGLMVNEEQNLTVFLPGTPCAPTGCASAVFQNFTYQTQD